MILSETNNNIIEIINNSNPAFKKIYDKMLGQIPKTIIDKMQNFPVVGFDKGYTHILKESNDKMQKIKVDKMKSSFVFAIHNLTKESFENLQESEDIIHYKDIMPICMIEYEDFENSQNDVMLTISCIKLKDNYCFVTEQYKNEVTRYLKDNTVADYIINTVFEKGQEV